jgi:hypothetical protein
MWAKTRLAIVVGFAASCGLAITGAAQADTVLDFSYSSSYGYIEAHDSISGASTAKYRPITALTVNNSADATSIGDNSAGTTYNLSPTAFDVSFTESRGGARWSYAQSYGELYFMPTDDHTTYALSGSYTFTTPYAGLFSRLYDVDTATYLFDEHTTFNDSGLPGGTFTVGGAEGQFNRTTSGALSGTLIAGHHYQWFYQATIQANPNADDGASATGGLRLEFSDLDLALAPGDPVPLPTTALGGLLLLGTLSARNLKRPRKAHTL